MISFSTTILLLQFACAFYVSGERLSLDQGEDFNIRLAPFQVMVTSNPIQANSSFCRGALVKDDTLITSAHCMSKLPNVPKELLVLNGFAPKQNYWVNSTVKKITPHPNFKAGSTNNDIAVIKTETSFASKPISYVTKPPEEDTPCKAYSYKPNPPGVVDVNTTCVHNCQRAYNASQPHYDVDIKTMLCAKDLNHTNVICENYVGSSLVCGNNLAGLAIYTQGCMNRNMSTVFVSMAPYAKWLDSTINASSFNSMSPLSVIIGTLITFSVTKLLSINN